MNDPTERWSADLVAAPAPQAALPLVEPAEWLEWDELDGPEAPVPLAGAEAATRDPAPETLAELRPEGGAEDDVADGVGALRAILLGGEPREYGLRLAAIERRLDERAARPAARPDTGPDERDARLAALEQRVERLAESIEQARDAARGADVTLDSLHVLQRQLDDLRRTQAHLEAGTAERARDAEERCRLRQRQVRTASRLELQRLRRRLYARNGAVKLPAEEGRAAQRPRDSQPPRPAHPLAEDPHAGLPGWDLREGQWTPAHSVAREIAQPADAPDVPDMPDALAADSGDDVDVSTAWRAVRRSCVAFLRALLAWVVILAQLAADDMRAAAQRIGELFRR
jgi:hypothetical protein